MNVKRKKRLSVFLLGFIVISAFFVFFDSPLRPKTAAILVEALPASDVYVDGKRVGRTPFEGEFRPGKVTVTIDPESVEGSKYRSKVDLTAGVTTIVRRIFDLENNFSSGEIVTFNKDNSNQISLAVVSRPDDVQVSLDGQILGVTPIEIKDLLDGQHRLKLEILGYEAREFSIMLVSGYKLIAFVELKPNVPPIGEEVATPP